MKVPCIAKQRLYGGYDKAQRENFVRVERGTRGFIKHCSLEYYVVSFNVEGRTVHVRCAPRCLETSC